VNLFHTKEFTAAELADLLESGGFAIDQVAGLHAAPRFAQLDAAHGGSFVAAQLDAAPTEWSEQLRRDVAGVSVADFRILAADVHDVDESLDLVVLAHRPG
jgi:predicted MPP superfamily phosphohydrolase